MREKSIHCLSSSFYCCFSFSHRNNCFQQYLCDWICAGVTGMTCQTSITGKDERRKFPASLLKPYLNFLIFMLSETGVKIKI